MRVDDELCEHSKIVILGLRKKLDKLEAGNDKIRRKCRILWVVVGLSWLMVFAMKI